MMIFLQNVDSFDIWNRGFRSPIYDFKMTVDLHFLLTFNT